MRQYLVVSLVTRRVLAVCRSLNSAENCAKRESRRRDGEAVYVTQGLRHLSVAAQGGFYRVRGAVPTIGVMRVRLRSANGTERVWRVSPDAGFVRETSKITRELEAVSFD
jgi:hypothetical protein